MRRLKTLGVIIASGLLAAACGTSSSGNNNAPSSSSSSSVLTIDNESGQNWTCSFNPFNPSVNYLAVGPVYEPLMFVNTLQSAKTTPWLATSFAWSHANKVLTFTIRNGVKFSNGSPMTAADVAFTFNLLKKNPALDLNAIWSVLSSVVQKGSNQVVVTFKTQAVPYFYYIADQVPIVPKSIWSTIKNPVTYSDANPVGTGAYKVSPCTPQNFTFVPNTHYWQPGEPKIAKVNYPAFTSNNTANTYLATGQAQWGSQFIPSINSFYLSKSPDNHIWFPPIANVTLIPNLKDPLLSNVAVRQAIAYAINKEAVAKVAFNGYAAPAEGVVPAGVEYSVKLGPWPYDVAKAKQLLTEAGYPNGFETELWSAYNHTIAQKVTQVIQQQLQQIGIKTKITLLEAGQRVEKVESWQDPATAPVRLYYVGWSSSTGEADWALRPLLFSESWPPKLFNTAYYKSDKVDADIKGALATSDGAQKAKFYKDAQEQIWQDAPWAPLVTERLLSARNKKLSGVYVMPDASFEFEQVDLQ